MAAVPATTHNNSANIVDLELGSVELDRFPEDELEVKGDLKSWGTSDLDVLMNLVRIRGLNDADILKVRAFASNQPTNHRWFFFFGLVGSLVGHFSWVLFRRGKKVHLMNHHNCSY